MAADFDCHRRSSCLCHHSASSGCQLSVIVHCQSHGTLHHYYGTTLLPDIQSSPYLPVFRQRLIALLFRQSFPDIVLRLYYASVDFVLDSCCYFSHTKNF